MAGLKVCSGWERGEVQVLRVSAARRHGEELFQAGASPRYVDLSIRPIAVTGLMISPCYR